MFSTATANRRIGPPAIAEPAVPEQTEETHDRGSEDDYADTETTDSKSYETSCNRDQPKLHEPTEPEQIDPVDTGEKRRRIY